jgi:hypothetical protein
MCYSEPTIYGMTLTPGMEIEDGVPVCCDDEMTSTSDDKRGHRVHTCGCCGIVLEVDDLGLVWDIREKATL